ncbi:MAG: AmmeMemoRadiSam system protein B [Desulfobulbaceae bacterium]|nr:AmmeMemoRadiSam system protein B [Desulfobulbaceae bacterium]
MSRAPIVSGRFYPADPAQLKNEVARYMQVPDGLPRKQALAVVLPHAGYVYSGETAGATLARVEVPETVLIMCPNHSGMGAPCALSPDDWRMPGMIIPKSKGLAAAILQHSTLAQEDSLAHQREHSLEVLLPFLFHAQPNLHIAALCLGGLSFAQCSQLAQELHLALQACSQPALVVASTDMNHFASREEGSRKDQHAIDRVLALDAPGLFETVRVQRISMCGVLPVSVAILLALSQGARKAELVRYTDSGEASGMLDQVVGYAGFVIS